MAQNRGDKDDNGNFRAGNGKKPCKCYRPDDPCIPEVPSTANDRSCDDKCQINQPDSPCSGNNAKTAGPNTVNIRYKKEATSGVSDMRVKADCVRIPLKSGGALDFTWYNEPSYFYPGLYIGNFGWLPARAGGYFSFFPYILIGDPEYQRLSRYGIMRYQEDIVADTKTYVA